MQQLASCQLLSSYLVKKKGLPLNGTSRSREREQKSSSVVIVHPCFASSNVDENRNMKGGEDDGIYRGFATGNGGLGNYR